jgi:hypothetical protein
LEFRGQQQVYVPNSASIDIRRDLTLELWVKLNSFPNTWQPIVQKGDGSGPGTRTYALWVNNQGYLSFVTSDGSQQFVDTPVSSIRAGQWYHFAGVIDRANGQMRVYLDGQEAANGPVRTTDSISHDSPLLIGSTLESFGGLTSFNGFVDEVRLWNTVRTEQQVRASMNTPLTGSEAGLAAYWRFDERTGTFVNDATSNQNHGLLGATRQPARVRSTVPLVGSRPDEQAPLEERSFVFREPIEPMDTTLLNGSISLRGPGGVDLGPVVLYGIGRAPRARRPEDRGGRQRRESVAGAGGV